MKVRFVSAAIILVALAISLSVSSRAQDTTRVIEVHAKRYSFDPADITVTKGETVKLVLISDDVEHSLVIPDLHVNEEISKDHQEEVTITPDSTGDFKGMCGRFCGSGHGSMAFTVHVKDK
jgi:cytochrome c oxidase subunit 2